MFCMWGTIPYMQNEVSRSTRRNHIGQFTTTVILADTTGRLYGHGMTREAAEASATRKVEIYYGNREWRLSPHQALS